MAEKLFLVDLNLNQNKLIKAVLQTNTGELAGVVTGQIYYNNSNNSATFYNGTEHVPVDARLRTGIPTSNLATNPLARANHTGTQLASTISDLASTVKAYRLDEFAAPTAAVSIGSQRLTNVANPTDGTDAANKQYVLAAVEMAAASIDSKPSVRAVSTTNIALSGAQTIDGVAVVAGDRVLVRGQTDPKENGSYVVAAGAWSRAVSSQSALTEINPGAFWFVEEGTTYGKTQWRIENTGTIVVGTDNITVNQFGAATTYQNGDGLNLTGITFSVKPSTGISVSAAGVAIDASVVARKETATFGNGTDNVFSISHSLSSTTVVVQIRDAATNVLVEADVDIVDSSTVQVSVNGTPPASNSLRVVIIG